MDGRLMPIKTPNDDFRIWLDIVLEEYRTLRAESLLSIQAQHTVLEYGMAALGALAVVGFGAWNNVALSLSIFLVVLPAVSLFLLVLWINEHARMLRAGLFIATIEDKINQTLNTRYANPGQVLSWETWLQEPPSEGQVRRLALTCNTVNVFFLLIAAASIIIANYKISSLPETIKQSLPVIIGDIAMMVFFAYVALFLHNFRKKIQIPKEFC